MYILYVRTYEHISECENVIEKRWLTLHSNVWTDVLDLSDYNAKFCISCEVKTSPTEMRARWKFWDEKSWFKIFSLKSYDV